MAWLELTIDCDRATAVRLSEFFSDAGAVSVSLSGAGEDVLIERGPGNDTLWPSTRVRGLFKPGVDITRLRRTLQSEGFGAPRVTRVDDQQWSQAWQQHVRPQRFGERLWVLPSFADPSDYEGVRVCLDPGLAFGSGSHASTALCLEWLERGPLDGLNFIDYGCGSGILAIAAIMLGAHSARCVDNDARALGVARENARNNRVEDRLSFFLPESLPPEPVPLLVANILAGPLVELAPTFSSLLKQGGRIALSGILSEQSDAVCAAYRGYIEFEAAESRDGWVRLSGTRL